MILSDKTILRKIKTGEIKIEPFDRECLQPASYDLHLGNSLLMFDEQKHQIIDVKKPVDNQMKRIELKDEDSFVLMPSSFVLANTVEIVGVDSCHIGQLDGKSSLGRLGLLIHAMAGFLDPGNEVRLTLNLFNLSSLPIKIYPKMKIAQIVFEKIDNPVKRPYGDKSLNSKYYKNMDVMPSSMFKNFEKD